MNLFSNARLGINPFWSAGILLVVLQALPVLADDEREIGWREVLVTIDTTFEGIEGHENHALGLMRQRGFAFYEDGDVAKVNAWVTFERVDSETSYRGYAVYRFSDGATKVGRFTGSGDPGGTQSGEFTFEAGTDRYQGITGQGTFTGQGFPPHGDIYLDVSGTYAVPE